MGSLFREHLFPPGHPRLSGLDRLDAYSYGDAVRDAPVVADVLRNWMKLFQDETFRGITSDGVVIPGLFTLGAEEKAPTRKAVTAAAALLEGLSPERRVQLTHPLGSRVWRAWMNPEFYVNRYGLRLEELDAATRELVMQLVRASVSPQGYQTIRNVMRINGFLGELVGLPKILNEHSYNINLFGSPSHHRPWGWSLYGHHLALNCLFVGGQQVFTPVFLGAEPNEIDTGAHAGTTVLTEHQKAGLALIRSLPPELVDQAVLFHRKRDPDLPPGRLHPGDELHLGGCFQDNRIIGTEGLPVATCAPEQKEQVLALVDLFLGYQPDGPRTARLTEVRRHLDRTWFCWIGGTGSDDAFYYRVQSPVIIVEFDHHAGIWLTNPEPERFHIHTLVRTPNGNDYGVELVRQALNEPHLLDGPA
ncbi:DUF3500 domain-containing protein [Nonomuraea jabiensis]|uniref:DUF3500 domain-containing protein n=1 Tax=Nonomuraea jabiensis TaxID=882448 RepID=UPI00343E4E57